MIYVVGDSNVNINKMLILKANELAKELSIKTKILFIDDEIKKHHKGYDVGEIILLKNKYFRNYDYYRYSKALLKIFEDVDIVLFPSNEKYKEVASTISYKLNLSLLREAVDLKVEDGEILVGKFSSNEEKYLEYSFKGPGPYLITLKNIFSEQKSSGKEIDKVKVIKMETESPVLFIENIEIIEQNEFDIENTDIVFAGGRGLTESSFNKLREIATFFKGAVAGSRPMMEKGLIKPSEQVGQSGKIINPKIYLAFGISGAIQHITGMRGSDVIIVINNNKDSNIFKYADYAIVSDANLVIEKMLLKIRQIKDQKMEN
ncbi:electron transfer flavoprotein subunit alpha/FixB family protein [Anaerosphaera multitolerans]|uniref:Electron transfer flavoprotein subunit alpha/FixB family protein n=1 Tax=Anaerosphaera multitolerans TaxID=2487351 RepID=A0A437S771_9FIRM|nr:electron transfer flavoprotein subunit alpha/FixB family protein [Anaerosphaera multitolerans]RVU54788.1 electron transfer flavoprotein subunit alpha/FixB family protein [Anaerosphaera multitolerans]